MALKPLEGLCVGITPLELCYRSIIGSSGFSCGRAAPQAGSGAYCKCRLLGQASKNEPW